MVYGTYNYSCWGESKPTYNWGGSHCSYMGLSENRLPPKKKSVIYHGSDFFSVLRCFVLGYITSLSDPNIYLGKL